MENLKELEKIMFEKYSDKLVFFKIGDFHLDFSIDDIPKVSWYGEDHNEFLDMAVKVGAKIIYYDEHFPYDTKEKYAKHADDIAELDLGFIHDGVFHTIKVYADWYDFSEDD